MRSVGRGDWNLVGLEDGDRGRGRAEWENIRRTVWSRGLLQVKSEMHLFRDCLLYWMLCARRHAKYPGGARPRWIITADIYFLFIVCQAPWERVSSSISFNPPNNSAAKQLWHSLKWWGKWSVVTVTCPRAASKWQSWVCICGLTLKPILLTTVHTGLIFTHWTWSWNRCTFIPVEEIRPTSTEVIIRDKMGWTL